MSYKYRKSLYPKIALLKAAYNYLDKAYVHLDADDEYYYVEIEGKPDEVEVTKQDFDNEMLAQSVRHEIYAETKNIRELLMARALATSVITDTAEKVLDDDNDDFDENKILRDWFSENG